MSELGRLDRDALAFGYGVASGYVVLVPTYTPMGESYPEWLPLMAWSLGPFLAALDLTMRHPDRAWELAALIEAGTIVGIILDIQVRSYLDIPSTVWPFAIVLVMVVSIPFLLAGTVLGRQRAKMKQRGGSHR